MLEGSDRLVRCTSNYNSGDGGLKTPEWNWPIFGRESTLRAVTGRICMKNSRFQLLQTLLYLFLTCPLF
jgi:hypothetical protein